MVRIAARAGLILFCMALAGLVASACKIPSNPLFERIKEDVEATKNSPDIYVTQAGDEYPSWGKAYAFPPILVDTSTAAAEFVIVNKGTADLRITEMTLDNSTDFVLTPPALPVVLAPNGTESFSVASHPTTVGEINSFVTVSSNDPDEGAYGLNIKGEGLAPAPEISVLQSLIEYPSGGSAYSFGELPQGVTGSPVTFTIKNGGILDLTVSAMSLGDSTNFAYSAFATPFTVAKSGGTRTFTVTFKPQSVATFNSAVTISNTDPDEGTYTLNISGTGAARQTIAVSSTSPANAATDVRIDGNILVVFDRDINPATITGTTVKQGLTNLPYSSSYNSGTHTLTLNPTSDLPTLSPITVTLPTTITGYNYELFAGYSFSFNTGTAWHDGNTVFVSTTGSAGNPGTKAQPLRSVQDGANKAVANGFTQVYVAEGSYKYSDGGLEQSATAGLKVSDPMTVMGGWNSTFTSYVANSVLDAESQSDHAIWVDSSNVTLKYLTVKGGLADGSGMHSYGGGIFIYSTTDRSNVLLENVTVDGNTSSEDGGGMYVHTLVSSVTLKSCTLTNNSAGTTSSRRGGGAYINAGFTMTLDAVSVTNNTGYTGGISVLAGQQLTIKNCNIYNNSGSACDAIELWGGNGITLQNNYIYAIDDTCVSLDSSSGGNISNLVITNNQFSSTTASPANVIAIREGQADISGHTITNNHFMTTYLAYLYQDNTGPTKIADDAAGLAILNTAGHMYHDASTASGNQLD